MVWNVFPISIFHNTWVVALLFCWTISSEYPFGGRYRYEMVGYETEITKTAFRRCGSGNSGINPASYQITSQLTNRLSQRNSLILPTRQKYQICKLQYYNMFKTYFSFHQTRCLRCIIASFSETIISYLMKWSCVHLKEPRKQISMAD